MLPRLRVTLLLLLTLIGVTGGLVWFAINHYRFSVPLAEETLRGLALTMATAMEGIAGRDSSLQSLASFQTSEVAYAVFIGADGEILFHTNKDLVGSRVTDQRYHLVLASGQLREERIRLGTGETVYEFQTPVHYAGTTCILRLALHTWRSEAVLRQARQEMAVIFSLLGVGWLLGAVIVQLLRQQVRQQRQAAQQAELVRLGEVGAVLAHEVRNPLAGIKGYGQLLEERLPAGNERGFATVIVNEARRLEALAEDILLYTRSEPWAAASCRLQSVAGEVQELLSSQAKEQEVVLASDIPAGLQAVCPPDRMRQVLLNLVTNGLQASSAGGMVKIVGCKKGTWAEIRVVDSGSGIAAEMQAVLFEPFRTSKARGAGLGLAVSKKIVESCGGSIEARNRPDGGAEFKVLVPAGTDSPGVEERG